jgi:alcohol-forming fatty acyl-CoA reductase
VTTDPLASAPVTSGSPAPADLVATRLAGARVLVTGATGFIGEALVARLLADLPDTRVALLVRARPGQSAADRVAALLGGVSCAPARKQLGVPDGPALLHALAGRLDVVEGDLDERLQVPGEVDVVIHCAGTVSFDPAIDEGFEVNVAGVEHLLRAVRAGDRRPHVVHVSTAYVNGARTGAVREGPLALAADRAAEAAAARRLRVAAEDASRTPQALADLVRAARREAGRSGAAAVAAEAERLRREQVETTLVDAGRERARSLGFTDCYTMTKAIGEQAAAELAADLPLTVVRPSIVESALAVPHPGWITGFKMAEPLILAYGRGELPELPGNPDITVDVIPVDLVVNGMIVAASSPPPAGSPRYVHLSSGARNPLRLVDLYRHVREHFLAHPLPARDRGTYGVPDWEWIGPRRVAGRLHAAQRLHKVASRVVDALPRSAWTAEAVRNVDRQAGRLAFLTRLLELYRVYATAEPVYRDDGLRALEAGLADADRASFPTDPRAVDWRHYLVEVHCPSVTALLRDVTTKPRAALPTAAAVVPSTGREVVAAFDLDGTLLPTNVVTAFLALRLADAPGAEVPGHLASAARAVPGWLAAERRDRAEFLRDVYRRYAGASLAGLDRLVDEELADRLLASAYAPALRRVREHRRAGHRTVLVTGALRALTRPLAPLFDEVVAADLDHVGGIATGHLACPPAVGEARAAWLHDLALERGVDLSASYAYADSASDLPMLRAVGHPVAVSPDVALRRAAKKARWPVEEWSRGGRAPAEARRAPVATLAGAVSPGTSSLPAASAGSRQPALEAAGGAA